MTLSTLPRYDRTRATRVGESAVVVGGSMAGLLAGRVLADAYDEVTVLERDPLPDESVARRGVAQAGHVHVMLEAGRVTLEDLLPGFAEDVLAAGGISIDAGRDLSYYQKGGVLADTPKRLPMLCASRPLFEKVVRRRVREHDGVDLRGECSVTGYVANDGATRVEGVEFRPPDGDTETLPADIVVDATGRTSRTPDWLERHHYAPPAVEDVKVDLAYSTTVLERPPEDRRGFLVTPSPPRACGGTAVPVEGDRWVVTLFGMHGEHPPTDDEGFREFAADLPTPLIGDLLEQYDRAIDEIRHYPFPSSRRRRYEDLHRFPSGLLVTGDAVASFNPIYGQGMSVAALDALALHHALADGEGADLPHRFFDLVAEVVDIVWRMTVGADFEFEATTGPKPFGTDLFNSYIDRLVRSAHSDGYVSEEFARVLRLEREPEALLSPDVLWRVLAPSAVVEHV
jgi:2-polyprenyl-6-methoxyphenol hydroxylase-like FAD-dependent oxidoreductase